jgi:lysophospholipase L1-like esterase
LEKPTHFLATALPLLLLVACSDVAPGPAEGLAESRQAASLADGWVGTWAVSPQGDGTVFQDKTLRQIVHTSIGGSSVRVRISNVFGSQALNIDDVHVAERSTGSGIALATDHGLKFAGQASVNIPAGQAATSDAVAFDVKPLSDLAVSFHLAESNNATTGHGTGLQDNYVADGDVAGSETLNGAQTKGSYYFLTNVDVQNPAAWGAVVTLGASITDGVASGGNKNRRWPNDLAKRLSDAQIPVGVLNQGISGNRLLADGSGESALKRFERDVLAQPGVRWVIFSDDPINDLGAGNAPTGPQLIDGLKQLVAQAHAAKLEFWCSTLTPFEGSGGWKPAGETARSAIHTFIKSADSGCDAIVDQDKATHDPSKPTWYLPAFDAGDHLHPNEAGLQAIADAVDLKGFTSPVGAGGTGGGAGGSAGAAVVAGASGSVNGGQSGSAAGGAGTAGLSSGGAASANAGKAGANPSATAGSAGQAGAASSPPAPASDSGCSCKLGAPAPRGAPGFSWSLVAAVAFGRFARRRARVTSPGLASKLV